VVEKEYINFYTYYAILCTHPAIWLRILSKRDTSYTNTIIIRKGVNWNQSAPTNAYSHRDFSTQDSRDCPRQFTCYIHSVTNLFLGPGTADRYEFIQKQPMHFTLLVGH
jgi:hypothetical protein